MRHRCQRATLDVHASRERERAPHAHHHATHWKVTTPVPPATTVPLTTPPIATTTTPLPPEVVTAYLKEDEEDEPVVRAQILLMTADVSNAGTDDPVKVMLNNGNETWLDYGRDDFERGDTFTYDLNLDRLNDVKDVDFINISKTGSDGWCISYLALLINGRVVFDRAFSPGRWLDDSGGYSPTFTISGSEIESHPNWQNRQSFSPTIPYIIPRSELESRIESIVGHFLHSQPDLYWEEGKSKWVEVYPDDSDTIEVDLDLQAVDHTPFADPWVDVNFFIDVSCSEGEYKLELDSTRTKVNSKDRSFLVAAITLVLEAHIPGSGLGFVGAVVWALADGFVSDFRFTNSVETGIAYCAPISVTEDGDVVIGQY